MTPKKIYATTIWNDNSWYKEEHWFARTPYILETEHLKTIESWKEEEKIWIKQLAEKDAEIERLKSKNNESFMVFENSNSEEGLVQLSISLKGLDNAREYVKTWKGKRLYIYQFIE